MQFDRNDLQCLRRIKFTMSGILWLFVNISVTGIAGSHGLTHFINIFII